jgi:uncharacterized OsmC-like protein
MSGIATDQFSNGVDVETLSDTVDAIRERRDLARFTFRARNRWVSGTHSQNISQGFYGAGSEREHERMFVFDADHPMVLAGSDNGPTPVELLLYALASCITAGIANIAASRGVMLTRVESTALGDIDLQGSFGLSDAVRNGYQQLRMRVTIEGDASPETLHEILEQSRSRSPVYDVIANGVPVQLDTVA